MVEFDPDWEYYQADLDVLAGVYGDSYNIANILFGSTGRGDLERIGMWVGAKPGWRRLQLAYVKEEYVDDELCYHRACKKCGAMFLPKDRQHWHCSRACKPSPGRPRSLAPVFCAYCRSQFPPVRAGQLYCTTACRQAHTGVVGPRSKTLTPEKREELTRLYTAGEKLKVIAQALGVIVPTVQKWRRLCGLAPRRPSTKE